MIKDNQGMTLIEVITVMTIIAILTVAASISLSILGLGNALDTAKRIRAGLEYVQIQNMSKSKPYYLTIEKTDEKYYLSVIEGDGAGSNLISHKKLDMNNGKITYKDNSSSEYMIGDTDADGNNIKLVVSFNKDTGGVRPDAVTGKTVTEIEVAAADRHYNIMLVEATGKIIMQR